jgi:hypothetical protein
MEERVIKSWEAFEEELVKINEDTKVLQQKGLSRMDYPLFRGHSDSEWNLESTLDRIQRGMSLSDYRRIVKIVHENVATCTGRSWDIEADTPTIFLGGFNLPLPTIEFMAYLRHNGFPSPLLDWTRSPYIAAFFAFRDIYPKKKDVFAAECPVFTDIRDHVSIFVFREFAGLSKEWDDQEPHIHSLGPTITTHRNHYLQQSEYLLCVGKKRNGEWVFADYQDVTPREDQDVLVKYNIPISEQQKVLKKLDTMNITAYSLFDSETSLMETLALREIVLK